MKKNLPYLLIEDSEYEGLYRFVERGSIGKFTTDLVRSHVAHRDLGAQYRGAARDAARERKARAWTEGLIGCDFA